MALRLMQHPAGPTLTPEQKAKRFRSYVDLANWADDVNLLAGRYFARAHNAASLATIREVTFGGAGYTFHVEGRGNV